MATERAAVMKCPECGDRKVDSLASSEALLRYQCGNPKCLHQWTQPRERGLSAIREAMDRRSEKEESEMADEQACRKGCGRTKFSTPRGKGQHERYCKGDAGDGSVEENPDLPMPKPEKVNKPKSERKPRKANKAKAPWAKAGESRRITKLATPAADGDAVLENIVRMIEEKRTERIAQLCAGDAAIEKYDRAIAALGGTRPI